MYQFFINEEIKINSTYSFNNDDAHHIKNVLRLKKGEVIRIVYNTNAYFGSIDYINGNSVVNIIEKDNISHELDINVTLIQSLIKNDKFDFVLQKSCELGVSNIVPLFTSRSNIRKDSYNNKLERFKKIILESCKQCKREVVPSINSVIDLKDINSFKSDINLFAYELDNINDNGLLNFIEKGKSVTIVIGCEGGFTEQEATFLSDNGFIPINLGKRILRAETASIYALSIVSAVNEVSK